MNRYFLHPTSFIDEDVRIGEGTQIWHFSHILKGSSIGKNCKIGQNVMIGPNVSVGDGCKIQNNVSIYEGVTLEDNVFCGPSCVFTNVFNPRSEIPRMSQLRTTLVKKGATIGANATIICGNNLGKYCFVGAGAVVTKEVPDYALVYGNPARIQGWMCECGVNLEFKTSKAICKACKKEYRKKKDIVEKIK
ncbi:MAG: acetyltransferase [Candidatus Omnitrophica bacterium]|nr:acetyltransferase [Candidatus Omnitrophota bacterium]